LRSLGILSLLQVASVSNDALGFLIDVLAATCSSDDIPSDESLQKYKDESEQSKPLTRMKAEFSSRFGILDSGKSTGSSFTDDSSQSLSNKRRRSTSSKSQKDPQDEMMERMKLIFATEEQKENQENRDILEAIQASSLATSRSIAESSAANAIAIREGNTHMRASFDGMAAAML
jgi:hypothetical protein